MRIFIVFYSLNKNQASYNKKNKTKIPGIISIIKSDLLEFFFFIKNADLKNATAETK